MNALKLDDIDVIGFDLDDTLHSFKAATSSATKDVLLHLSSSFALCYAELRSEYEEILKAMQKTNFTENKPSSEYRRSRFQKLLSHFCIDDAHVETTLKDYDEALAMHLCAKPFAENVLEVSVKLGKRVIVITEGPTDAQQLTLDRLGLSKWISNLFTSAMYETSKTEDLFTIALDSVGCEAHRCIYVGDNPERDYFPSLQLGINAILFSEDRHVPNVAHQVHSLKTLVDMFGK